MNTVIQSVIAKLNLRMFSVPLAVVLAIAHPTWAGYVPPTQPSAPRTPTTTTGRRGGCVGDQATSLTALAPQSHVGQTVSSRPAFAWYVPDTSSLPMEFYLYETIEDSNRLVYRAEMFSVPGIMSLMLPEAEPGLQVGQSYQWKVVLLCNPNRPSSALVVESQIDVVEMSGELQTNLQRVSDRQERAELYAASGLWYDAVAETLLPQKEIRDSMTPSSVQPEFLELIADLATLEAAAGQRDRSIQLEEVKQALRQLTTHSRPE